MKTLPRLRLEPRPTRLGFALVVVACAATSVLVLVLPLPSWASISCAGAIASVLAVRAWRCLGRGMPALLHIGIDRRITVTDRDGRTRSGAVLDDSYVGAWLTTIVWCDDDDPWWRPARAILVLPDTLPCDAFRQLRTRLRYGRPPVDEATSGEDAG